MPWGFEHHPLRVFRHLPPAHLLLCFSPYAGTPRKADGEPSRDPPGYLAGSTPWALQPLTSAAPTVLTASRHTKRLALSQPARRGQAAGLSGQVAKRTLQNASKPSGDQRSEYANYTNPRVLLSGARPQLPAPALAVSPSPWDVGKGGCQAGQWGGCEPACVMVGGQRWDETH